MSNLNVCLFRDFCLHFFCPILIQCFHLGSMRVAVGAAAEVGAKCLSFIYEKFSKTLIESKALCKLLYHH